MSVEIRQRGDPCDLHPAGLRVVKISVCLVSVWCLIPKIEGMEALDRKKEFGLRFWKERGREGEKVSPCAPVGPLI